jgi:hypothetical protein
VLLATLFTLVGCGGTPRIRRPLVTDKTPLGTPRERVVAWHHANGWCETAAPVLTAQVEVFHPCELPDRHMLLVVLAFSADDELVGATVTVHVPPPERPTNALPGSAFRSTAPRGSFDHRHAAVRVMEALATELEARYGAPTTASWTERVWFTRTERIQLRWVAIDDEMFVVNEEHAAIARN